MKPVSTRRTTQSTQYMVPQLLEFLAGYTIGFIAGALYNVKKRIDAENNAKKLYDELLKERKKNDCCCTALYELAIYYSLHGNNELSNAIRKKAEECKQ